MSTAYADHVGHQDGEHGFEHLRTSGNHRRTSSQLPLLAKFSKAPSKSSKRPFGGPSLVTEEGTQAVQNTFLTTTTLGIQPNTPLTPMYQFGHDYHFSQHHETEHAPNAHNHLHTHSHEGHSHNMRGVFLHVMAVWEFFFFIDLG